MNKSRKNEKGRVDRRLGAPNYRTYLILCVLVSGFLFLTSPPAEAQSTVFQEYQVKAVFLYNLSNFVSWPEETFNYRESPFVIAILGEDPFGRFLDKVIQGETVNKRPIIIKRLTQLDQLKENTCHILFISASMKRQISEIIELTKNSAVLTVSDIEKFAHNGGIVGLIRKGSRVYIEINVDVARQEGLVISSKLLKLAKIVKKG